MPSVTIKWHTKDDSACPICKHINGYEWVFTDAVPDSLVHPVYGEIWNIYTGSLAHEHYQFGKQHGLLSTCRCRIEPHFDLKDLVDKIKILHDAVMGTETLMSLDFSEEDADI